MSSPRSQLLRRKPADCVSSAASPIARRAPMPAKASQPLSAQIGKGSTWDEAVNDIAWSDGDVLVVWSSSLSRSCGSSSLARDQDAGYSPVPVVVVSRGAIEDPTAG